MWDAIRAGFVSGARQALIPEPEKLHAPRCPFANTADRMEPYRWLEPRIVAVIEFLEWTPERRLRHPRFAGFFPDGQKPARDSHTAHMQKKRTPAVQTGGGD